MKYTKTFMNSTSQKNQGLLETLNKDCLSHISLFLHVFDVRNLLYSSKELLSHKSQIFQVLCQRDFSESKPSYESYKKAWTMRLNRLQSKARQIEVPISIVDDDANSTLYRDYYTECRLGEYIHAHKDILDFIISQNPMDGDIIHLKCLSEYRNDGKMIWWKGICLDFDAEIDDYGSVPPIIKVLDDNLTFGIHHWEDAIDHNQIIYFDATPYLIQIRKNIGKIEKHIEMYSHTAYAIIGEKREYITYCRTSHFSHKCGVIIHIHFVHVSPYKKRYDTCESSEDLSIGKITKELFMKAVNKGQFYYRDQEDHKEDEPFKWLYINNFYDEPKSTGFEQDDF